ncbi:unnamed protein product, partial [Ectocarpus fasciculatus]
RRGHPLPISDRSNNRFIRSSNIGTERHCLPRPERRNRWLGADRVFRSIH